MEMKNNTVLWNKVGVVQFGPQNVNICLKRPLEKNLIRPLHFNTFYKQSLSFNLID